MNACIAILVRFTFSESAWRVVLVRSFVFFFFSLLFLCCFRMCSVWRAVDCTWRDIITYIYISLSIVCARSSCGLYTNWNGEYIIYTVVLGASTNKTTSIHKQQFHLFQFVVFFFCSLLSRSVSSIVVSKTYFDFSMFDGS